MIVFSVPSFRRVTFYQGERTFSARESLYPGRGGPFFSGKSFSRQGRSVSAQEIFIPAGEDLFSAGNLFPGREGLFQRG